MVEQIGILYCKKWKGRNRISIYGCIQSREIVYNISWHEFYGLHQTCELNRNPILLCSAVMKKKRRRGRKRRRMKTFSQPSRWQEPPENPTIPASLLYGFLCMCIISWSVPQWSEWLAFITLPACMCLLHRTHTTSWVVCIILHFDPPDIIGLQLSLSLTVNCVG